VNLLDVMLKYPDILLSRDSIIDLFAESNFSTRAEAETSGLLKCGKIFTEDGLHYVVTKFDTKILETIKLTSVTKLNPSDKLTITKDSIINYTGAQPLVTSVGRFLLNYTVLVVPFKHHVEYINESPWNIGKIEGLIANQVIAGNITAADIYQYIDNAYHLSSYNDFFVPAMSERSITSRPEVDALRKELFTKYAEQLKDPTIMAKVEDELIALDKELLEGDMSNGFMIESKNYNVHRKRMFIAIGMVETFGNDQEQFEFGKTNLNDGWDLKELPLIADDTRRGFYQRGKDTAKGGAESKFIGRNFQDSKINMDDCGDPRGLPLRLTEYNSHHFLRRNIIDNGKVVELTKDNLAKYLNKTVKLRSPMYCKAKFGYCYTCMDSRFKDIQLKMLNIAPINISSTILNISMKAMHGTKVAMLDVNDINLFLV